MGLRCRQKRSFKATTNSQHEFPVAENLLDQTFKPTSPNRIWVADITYVPTEEGWLYLAGIKDVFTCELVGYAIGARMTQDLTAQALFRAVQQKRPEPGVIHHSDRGSQYCAHAYRNLLTQFGMTASMSRKGNCFDNAPMESFWGTGTPPPLRYASPGRGFYSGIHRNLLQPTAPPFTTGLPSSRCLCTTAWPKTTGRLKTECPFLTVDRTP